MRHFLRMAQPWPLEGGTARVEAFNVRTAWHGSAAVSPVGHAANLMLDMNVWYLGIQEASVYLNTHETLKEVFPGTPEVRRGYMWPNGKPGLRVDSDEKLAARFPGQGPGRPQYQVVGQCPARRWHGAQAVNNTPVLAASLRRAKKWLKREFFPDLGRASSRATG